MQLIITFICILSLCPAQRHMCLYKRYGTLILCKVFNTGLERCIYADTDGQNDASATLRVCIPNKCLLTVGMSKDE